jgi:hypothetical protein
MEQLHCQIVKIAQQWPDCSVSLESVLSEPRGNGRSTVPKLKLRCCIDFVPRGALVSQPKAQGSAFLKAPSPGWAIISVGQ